MNQTRQTVALVWTLGVLALASGCGDSESARGPLVETPPPVSNPDGSPAADPLGLNQVHMAFQSADATLQLSVQEMITAAQGGDYAAALESFRGLASNPSLTPDQKQAVENTLAQLRKRAPL